MLVTFEVSKLLTSIVSNDEVLLNIPLIFVTFDVLNEEDGLAERGTFILDPEGIVQAYEINAGGIGRDASTLVNKIKAAQYVRNNPGEVCPAKWQEGGETLTPSLDLVGKI